MILKENHKLARTIQLQDPGLHIVVKKKKDGPLYNTIPIFIIKVSNPNKVAIYLPLAQFLIALGTSKIAAVLPTINEHFGITQTNLQWIHNACVIAFGTLLSFGWVW